MLLKWGLWFFFPVKRDKIVACSFNGKGYSDNPKYILQALLGNEKQQEIVWLMKDMRETEELPPGIRACRFGSVAAAYHLATAGIWIDNVRKKYLYKKEEQLYIQTWHGIGAMKRVEKDAVGSLWPDYARMAVKDSKAIDIFLSSTEMESGIYRNSFWYDGRIYEIGSPRNDIIYRGNAARKKIRDMYQVNEDCGIVLYAPTFRDNTPTDVYLRDEKTLLKACRERFGMSDCLLLVRLHPNMMKERELFLSRGKHVIDVTDYPDSQELLVAADILISDYSSIMVDFCITGKPVFRLAKDVDRYRGERDFYLDIEEYPFPLASSEKELEQVVLDYDEQKHLKELSEYFDKVGMIENRHASEDVAEIIRDYMTGCSKEELFRKYDRFLAKLPE